MIDREHDLPITRQAYGIAKATLLKLKRLPIAGID
jgi:hypothetical protein